MSDYHPEAVPLPDERPGGAQGGADLEAQAQGHVRPSPGDHRDPAETEAISVDPVGEPPVDDAEVASGGPSPTATDGPAEQDLEQAMAPEEADLDDDTGPGTGHS